jgi:hypothetical protein
VAHHFFVELLLQSGGRFHHRFGIRIFGFQMRDNFRIRFLAQPEVIVDHRVVVNFGGLGFLFSHGWSQGIGIGIGLGRPAALTPAPQ